MKRIIPVFIIISLMAVILCSCSKQENGDASSTASPDNAATVVTSAQTSQEADAGYESETDNNVISGDPAPVSSVDHPTPTSSGNTYGRVTGINAISQYPELPTGCEVTSLATVLNYYNINIDKCDIADLYLEKGAVGTVDFHKAFEGDPRDEASFGCYAGVIVDAANKIISEKGADLTVTDYTGTELEDLFGFVSNNIPVIVWGTQDCQEGHYTVTWNVDGEDLTWFSPEHCMVLVGFDDINVQVCDPIYGEIKSYDKETFKNCYDSLFKQAVVIS